MLSGSLHIGKGYLKTETTPANPALYRKTRAELPGLLWLAGLLADVVQQLLCLSLNAAAF